MQFHRMARLAIALSIAALAIGCGGADSGGSGEAHDGPVYTATGEEGNIYGVISYSGAAPAPRMISMASDPVCAAGGEVASEELLVSDGKLENAFVYVKSGLPNNTFAPADTEILLDQRGCRFHPHVLGIQVDQPIKIINSDATSHSIHPTPKLNREWNETQYQSASPIVRKFNREEVIIPVKCNLHSWMRAYIAVLSHPFFAVSASDGRFVIRGLPPGEYELEAWHETLGAKTLRVSVKARADIPANFTFGDSTVRNSGTLRVQPALVVP